MSGLIAAELRRMYLRRMVRAFTLLALAGLLVAAVIVYFHSSGSSIDRFAFSGMDEVLLGLGPLLLIFALVLGASYVGADWQKGTVTTGLTWEPRRLRTMLVRFLVAAVTGFALLLLLSVYFAALLYLVAATVGSITVPAGFWSLLAGVVLRISVVGALAGVVGCALASIGRNTAAAIGAAFVYFAVVEGLIRGLRPQWIPYLLGDNAAQFLSGGPAFPPLNHSSAIASVVMLVYLVVFMAVAAGLFVTRDVT